MMALYLHVAHSLTACCFVEKLAFMKSPFWTFKSKFDLYPPEEIQLGRVKAGFLLLLSFFPLFQKCTCTRKDLHWICALKSAVMFVHWKMLLCFVFKMQLKLEIALLVSFDQRSELVYTRLGEGRCRWEDEHLIRIKLCVQTLLQYNWILMVT